MIPETVNCWLLSAAWVIWIVDLPVFETETVCDADFPTATVPKLIGAGLNWNDPFPFVDFPLFALATPIQPLKNIAPAIVRARSKDLVLTSFL